MGMIKEFKEFAIKGNMMDMAVGIIMGAAFGTVIKSVVEDILMPVVSKIFNIPDFTNLFTILRMPENVPEGMDMTSLAAVREAGGSALAYGNFINNLLAFLLVAFALFMVIKGMNKMRKEEEEAPAGPSEVDLLTEIRDALAK